MASLFGWCLPDMTVQSHAKCKQTFDFNGPVSCGCVCHTDHATFLKEKAPKPKSTKETKPRTKRITKKEATK